MLLNANKYTIQMTLNNLLNKIYAERIMTKIDNGHQH
jgi:hypothetical protein